MTAQDVLDYYELAGREKNQYDLVSSAGVMISNRASYADGRNALESNFRFMRSGRYTLKLWMDGKQQQQHVHNFDFQAETPAAATQQAAPAQSYMNAELNEYVKLKQSEAVEKYKENERQERILEKLEKLEKALKTPTKKDDQGALGELIAAITAVAPLVAGFIEKKNSGVIAENPLPIEAQFVKNVEPEVMSDELIKYLNDTD